MMTKRLLLLLCLQGGAAINTWAQECKPLEQVEGAYWRTASITVPGKYCLTYDIVQSSVFDIHAGSFKSLAGNSLIEISYYPGESNRNKATGQWVPNPPLTDGDVFDIDLQGHSLKAKVDNMFGIRSNQASVPNIKIHHGLIDVPGNDSSNIGVSLVHFGGTRGLMLSREFRRRKTAYLDIEDVPAAETLDKKAPTYPSSNYLVENMTIRAGWRGVDIRGGGSVVRNSTIEVDGHTAISLQGPGSVIENNTIIIHGQGDARPFDAAIKLRDAKGAVVRNNRIIYKGGWFSKAPAAINLLDSTEVQIENNTVENFQTLVRVSGESRFSETGNMLK